MSDNEHIANKAITNEDTENKAITNEDTENKAITNEDTANEAITNKNTANEAITNEDTANKAIPNKEAANKAIPNKETANKAIPNKETANKAITNKDIKKFHKAIKDEDLMSIKKCMQKGLIINKLYTYKTTFKRNSYEFIPLKYAVENQKIEMVNCFLKEDPNVELQNGETALSIAIRKGNLKIVKLLIETSAKPNIMETALLDAIKSNKLDIAKCMVENGADILHKHDNNSDTMLSTAAKSGNLEMVKLLIENGAKPTIQKAFWHAIENNRLDMVTYMVQNGARVNWTYKNGDIPLVKSLIMKDEEIAKFLIDRDASLEEFDIENVKYTPLFYSLEHKLFHVFKHLLKKKGVDVNQKNNNEQTALAIAASKKYFRFVTCLIESKAKISLAQKEIDEYAREDDDFHYYYEEVKLKQSESKKSDQ